MPGLLVLRQQCFQRLADELAAPVAKQRLGLRVGAQDMAGFIHDQQPVRHEIESFFELAFRPLPRRHQKRGQKIEQ